MLHLKGSSTKSFDLIHAARRSITNWSQTSGRSVFETI